MYSDRIVIHQLQEICVVEAIVDRKLVIRRFCACAVKNRPKTRLLCSQIAKILARLWAIAVAEHDGIETR